MPENKKKRIPIAGPVKIPKWMMDQIVRTIAERKAVDPGYKATQAEIMDELYREAVNKKSLTPEKPLSGTEATRPSDIIDPSGLDLIRDLLSRIEEQGRRVVETAREAQSAVDRTRRAKPTQATRDAQKTKSKRANKKAS